MAPAATAPRTRKVETTTTEEVPLNGNENQGLGMPWMEYLATIPDDELQITDVKVYREEPKTGLVCKVSERVDDAWILDHFGGGLFHVRISSKSGKSHFERNVKIAGLPKFTAEEIAAKNGGVIPAATVPVAPNADNAAILALLEKTIDRLDRLQAGTAQPSPAQDQVVQIMADAARKAVEIVGNNNSKPPEDSMERDLQRLKLMAEIFKPQAPPQDKLRDAFQEAMIKKLLDPPPTANKSLIEELKGLGELRELMGWGEASGKGEHWTTALIHQAPAVLDKLGEISEARVQATQNELQRAQIIADARRGAPPPAAGQPPVQTSANQAPPRPAPGPGPAPAAGPLHMTPMDGSGAAPPPPAAPRPAGRINTQGEEFIELVKMRVVAMVQNGEPGGAIVGFLVGAEQQQFVDMLVKYEPEQIAGFLRNDPILRQAVDDPDWSDVLDEAREYVRDQEKRAEVQ